MYPIKSDSDIQFKDKRRIVLSIKELKLRTILAIINTNVLNLNPSNRYFKQSRMTQIT